MTTIKCKVYQNKFNIMSDEKKDLEKTETHNGDVAPAPVDPIGRVIGPMGRWQAYKIAIVFFVGIPGLAHIYSAAFVAAKTDYWCKDDLILANEINKPVANFTSPKNNDSCRADCTEYYFDHTFWESTILTDWTMVCDRGYLSGKSIKNAVLLFTSTKRGARM